MKILATGEIDMDGTMKKLSKGEEKDKHLKKKTYNKLILSCSKKISFIIRNSAKTKHLPQGAMLRKHVVN